jgi:hypothetical protein
MRNILNQCYSTNSKMQRKILFTAALSVSKDRGTEPMLVYGHSVCGKCSLRGGVKVSSTAADRPTDRSQTATILPCSP